MHRVILLDHLDARVAVLSDLINVGALHQAQADIRAIGCTPYAVGLRGRSEFSSSRMVLKSSRLLLGKNGFGRSGRARLLPSHTRGAGRFAGRVRAIDTCRAEPASKSLKGRHCAEHTVAISDAAFYASFNLEDRIA